MQEVQCPDINEIRRVYNESNNRIEEYKRELERQEKEELEREVEWNRLQLKERKERLNNIYNETIERANKKRDQLLEILKEDQIETYREAIRFEIKMAEGLIQSCEDMK